MIKFQGFQPDLEPATSGAILECEGIIPTTKGMKSAPSTQSAGITAASAEINALAVVRKLDDSKRIFGGTTTTLEEISAGGWIDRSRATIDYACGTDSRWSFAQFGNYTLASNAADLMQVSEAGDFANIADSPKAAHIAVSDGFVMAVNTDTTATDGWHCSAYLDHTDWTEAVSTQCTSGRIIGGGPFTGIKPFSNGFVTWKKNSTYVTSYVGAPVVFQFNEVPGDVGCPTGHSAVDIGDRIAFLGNDDFYIFDGANNVPIGAGVREWFFANYDELYIHRTIATYNPITANITWHFVSNLAGGDNPDTALVYNVRSGKWGKYSLVIEAAANYYAEGLIYNDMGSEYSTYDDLPLDLSYDSPYWLAGAASSGVIKSDHIIYTLTGISGESSMTINTMGTDDLFTTITRVRPRFLIAPDSSTLNYAYDDIYGDSFTDKGTYNLNNGKYDFIHSSRWHKMELKFNGNMEITGFVVNLIADGTE